MMLNLFKMGVSSDNDLSFSFNVYDIDEETDEISLTIKSYDRMTFSVVLYEFSEVELMLL